MKIFFDAHFVFTWVKGFRKVHSNFCSNLQGLGQPISHMCKLYSRSIYIVGPNFGVTFYHLVALKNVSKFQLLLNVVA